MSIRNEEQFKAWWESRPWYERDPYERDAAEAAWDEANKQRDEESNLIVGKGFWGKAVSNVSSQNKELKAQLEKSEQKYFVELAKRTPFSADDLKRSFEAYVELQVIKGEGI